ncbi:MAG: 3-dehydroquinate synthase [Propionibacteriaceae bacterium]|nr:3-dehydroquinate synthase [Propionibacteriaceae bacterium]
MSGVTQIPVTGERAYDVVVGHGVITKLPTVLGRLAGPVTTAIIHPPVLAGVAARLAEFVPSPHLIEVLQGEAAKTPAQLDRCWRALAEAGLTRSDVVIGLGGGATTDLAGFVAATYLRGVAYVAVPTTVLGMADAAVGGKTGINLPAGKNLVGAFYDPVAVLADLDLLAGLPSPEVRSGLAEIVKCGFIADPVILDLAASPAVADTRSAPFADALARAVSVKARAVTTDFREQATGGVGRAALNYGHTLGHAIEKAEGYEWAHGDAVAVGMVYAAEVARRLGLIGTDLVDQHRRVLGTLGLPVAYAGVPWADLRATMALDKKARGTSLRMVLLEGLGQVKVVADLDEARLAEAYAAIGS